tara:strand:+ start:492 stop:752 length:261 start_codon:yes stop_codon:yes gene_type:complete
MPSVVFNFGDTSKEVDLKDINSVEDVASNMKEVIKEEKKDDEFHGPINEGNRYPKHWFLQKGEVKPDYPESWEAAADGYELSEEVI